MDLIAAILEACQNGNRKTRIMYSAHINPRDVQGIMNFLVEKGLLYTEYDDQNHRTYKTTSKGTKFLDSYGEILKVLG